jgi:hypothetical protein
MNVREPEMMSGSSVQSKQMSHQPNSTYRYYYYYGSLSARRDGTAKGCRRVMIN